MVHLLIEGLALGHAEWAICDQLARSCGGSLSISSDSTTTRCELVVPVILPDRLATRAQGAGGSDAARSSHILEALGLAASVEEDGPAAGNVSADLAVDAVKAVREATEDADASKGKMVLAASAGSETLRFKAFSGDKAADPGEDQADATPEKKRPAKKNTRSRKKSPGRKNSKKKAARGSKTSGSGPKAGT
jgi:hypothetical protein